MAGVGIYVLGAYINTKNTKNMKKNRSISEKQLMNISMIKFENAPSSKLGIVVNGISVTIAIL